MTQQETVDRYHKYIGCINSNTMQSELQKYCQPQVTHNDRILSLDQYSQLIQDSKDAIPDLHFRIDTILFDEESQKLAVRLAFTGTPTGTVAGRDPTGQKVFFSEHVFYQLREGKIHQVWSLVDWDAVRLQLDAPT